MRSTRRDVLLLVGLLTAVVGIGAGAGPLQSYRLRTPGDSVRVRIGEFDRWYPLAESSSPDTTYLGVQQDLTLATLTDSVVVPWQDGPAWVAFVLDADTLRSLMIFEDIHRVQFERYRSLLRRYATFERTPGGAAFSFARTDSAQLEALRRAFPLDSIAGGGDDLDRMRRLRHWLHTEIRWDGSRKDPETRSIVETIATCRDGGHTLNCGGMASTYAAICQAVGLPARRIVCRSFDRHDPDSHSVDIVWSDSLGHWVYMDPSFDAEWTDGRGDLLDLQAARDRLVAGDTVIVSPDADVNGTPRPALEHLAYMSKNLFRFQTWLVDGTLLALEPVGYDTTATDTSAVPWPGVVTHDPDAFWRGPGF